MHGEGCFVERRINESGLFCGGLLRKGTILKQPKGYTKGSSVSQQRKDGLIHGIIYFFKKWFRLKPNLKGTRKESNARQK